MKNIPQTAEAVTHVSQDTRLNGRGFEGANAPNVSPTVPESPAAERVAPPPIALSGRAKIRAALDMARRGFSVFPVKHNEKSPAVTNWQCVATNYPDRVKKMFGGPEDYNIGGVTTGFLVIDIDTKKNGTAAWVAFVELNADEELPPTLVHKTASGGRHIIYRMPWGYDKHGRWQQQQVCNGTNVLGQGVDIRGRGGLIVLPGSFVPQPDDPNAGRYVIEENRPIAEAPEWLIREAKAARPKAKDAGERVNEETEWSVAAAWRLMEKWPAGDDPDAGDHAAYQHAAQLGDLGLEKHTALQVLCAWADRCDDPMPFEQLERKVENAYRYRQEPIGGRAVDVVEFEPIDMGEVPLSPEPPNQTKELPLLTAAESIARALTLANEPLIDDLLDRGTMSVLYGESNVGKSFVAMDMAFHVASGTPWAGRGVKQGPIVWVAAEGGAGVHKRVAALFKEHEAKGDDVPFYLVPYSVDLLHHSADVKPLVEAIRKVQERAGVRVEMVVLDTLSRALSGGDENSPIDMGMLVKHFDLIRAATGAHFLVVHHSGKDVAKGARGHSILKGATDTEIEIDSDRNIEARKQRDLERGHWFKFALRQVDVGVHERTGKPVNSCVVDLTVATEAIKQEAEERAQEDASIAQQCRAAIERGLKARGGGDRFNQAEMLQWIKDWAEQEKAAGRPPKTGGRGWLQRRLNSLRTLGVLDCDGGQGTRAGYWLRPAPAPAPASTCIDAPGVTCCTCTPAYLSGGADAGTHRGDEHVATVTL
jgi:hypothetical protein